MVLGATAVVALFSLMVVLSLWDGVAAPSLIWVIGAALIYVLTPILAIADLVRRKTSGRYLSYLTFLCTMAISLRGFLEMTARPVRADFGKAMIAMFFLGMIFVSASLLLGLIVSRKADEYFVESTGEDEASTGSSTESQDHTLLPQPVSFLASTDAESVPTKPLQSVETML